MLMAVRTCDVDGLPEEFLPGCFLQLLQPFTPVVSPGKGTSLGGLAGVQNRARQFMNTLAWPKSRDTYRTRPTTSRVLACENGHEPPATPHGFHDCLLFSVLDLLQLRQRHGCRVLAGAVCQRVTRLPPRRAGVPEGGVLGARRGGSQDREAPKGMKVK